MDKKESKILIDTDVLINFFDSKRKENLTALNAFVDFGNKDIAPYISIITVIEMLQGSKNNIEKERILKQIESFGHIFLSDEICLLTKKLIIKYSASHGLVMGDAFIAATALTLDIELFTFNKKDFKYIEQLRLYKF